MVESRTRNPAHSLVVTQFHFGRAVYSLNILEIPQIIRLINKCWPNDEILNGNLWYLTIFDIWCYTHIWVSNKEVGWSLSPLFTEFFVFLCKKRHWSFKHFLKIVNAPKSRAFVAALIALLLPWPPQARLPWTSFTRCAASCSCCTTSCCTSATRGSSTPSATDASSDASSTPLH